MEDIEIILDYLNLKAKSRFKVTDKNSKFISDRLKDSSMDEIKQVIDAKVSEWMGDDKMEKYLRPSTLFNGTKFYEYLGRIHPEQQPQLTQQQVQHRKYLNTDKWKSIRLKRLRLDHYQCQGCAEDVDERTANIHHLSYLHFGDEFLYELITLCRKCHSRCHAA